MSLPEFVYTAQLVEIILERYFLERDDIEDIDLYADVQMALLWLKDEDAVQHGVVVQYMLGLSIYELATAYQVPANAVQRYVTAGCQRLADRLNGKE